MTLEDNRKLRKMPLPVEGALGRLAAERQHEPLDDPNLDGLDEKEQYGYFYDRIYPLLKEGRLDYTQIAEKTEFKERRIRETLLFRLTNGEVLQLFGRKDGYCYICKRRLNAPKSTEPLCLKCLQSIDTAIQETHIDSLLSLEPLPSRAEPEPFIAKHEPAEPAAFTPNIEPSLPPLPETPSPEQYQALLNELNYYKTQALRLQPGIKPYGAEAGREQEVESPPPAAAAPESAQDTREENGKSALTIASSELLAILEMKEEELSTEHYWEPELSQHSQPLRHFGFQRLKSAGNERGGKW